VSWGTIQKVIVLLDIFAMIALWTGEPEEALFEDGIGSIPEAEREAKQTLFITDTQQPIFAPAIGTGAGMLMWKGIPGAPI
jgi:hypothetical protein